MAKPKFQFFNELPKKRIGTDDKDLRFFLSTKYDYDNKAWKSGIFKIDENLWDNSENQGLQFPIEGLGYIQLKHYKWYNLYHISYTCSFQNV